MFLDGGMAPLARLQGAFGAAPVGAFPAPVVSWIDIGAGASQVVLYDPVSITIRIYNHYIFLHRIHPFSRIIRILLFVKFYFCNYTIMITWRKSILG